MAPKPASAPREKGSGKKAGRNKGRAPKGPAGPETQEQKDARSIQQLLGPDTAGATALQRQFFPEGSLGRVSTGFDKDGNRIRENQDMLDRSRASMEAYGPGGGARRSADVSDAIERSRRGLDRSGEVQETLDRTKGKLGRSGETSAMLDQMQAMQGRSAETSEVLDRERRGLDRTGEDAALLDQMQRSTQRSGETQAKLDQADRRVGRTTETTGYLNRLNSATEGYNSAENQGMLEQQMRGINRSYQDNQTRLQNNAAKMGVRGGVLASLAAKNNKGASRAEAETRQELFVRNADEKQKRLLQYGDAESREQASEQDRFSNAAGMLRGAQSDEAGNRSAYASTLRGTQDAEGQRLQRYGSNLSGAESDEGRRRSEYADRLSGAEQDENSRERDYADLVRTTGLDDRGRISDFNSMVGNVEDREFAREADSRDSYNSTLQGIRGDELGRQGMNLDRVQAERSSQASTYFGGLEYSKSRKDAEEARRMNRNYYQLAKSQYGGRGRSSGGGQKAGPDMDGYFADQEKLIRERA